MLKPIASSKVTAVVRYDSRSDKSKLRNKVNTKLLQVEFGSDAMLFCSVLLGLNVIVNIPTHVISLLLSVL